MGKVLRAGLWSAALAGTLLALPVRADPSREILSPFDARLIESLISPRAVLGEVVTERDLDLLFAHVKAALLAAASGKEPPSSEELDRRAGEIARSLETRGTLAALVLLDALEASARQRLRELHRQHRAAPPVRMPGSI
jgi:hypothetical protein